MSTVIIADLCTPEGEELLMSWLQMPNVVGIFLVPPWDLLHAHVKSR